MTSPLPKKETELTPFQTLDWVLLCGAAGIWGASFFFIDIGLEAFSPGIITWFRVAFGCATLWLLPLQRNPVHRSDWPKIVLLAITWMAFPLTLFPIAQQWINSSLTGMMNSAMPIFTVIVAGLFFNTSTSRRQMVGVIIGLLGIFLIGIPEMASDGTNALGVVLVVAAVFSYGVAVNVAGPLQQKYGALPVLRRALLVAAFLTAPYAASGISDSGFGWGPLIACLGLGVGGTGFAYVMASQLTGRVGAVRTSIVTYLIPIVATVLGVLFRNDSVTAWALIGTVVVLGGAYTANSN
mgnify:FL=1